jgi:hypothetical protein
MSIAINWAKTAWAWIRLAAARLNQALSAPDVDEDEARARELEERVFHPREYWSNGFDK